MYMLHIPHFNALLAQEVLVMDLVLYCICWMIFVYVLGHKFYFVVGEKS